MIRNAEKLINDIDKKISRWNERSQFRIKSVGNLSRSDLEGLKVYANQYISNAEKGRAGFNGLMQPRGSIEKVLSKYELK